MLTADLVDARIVRGVVVPAYVDPADPDVRAAAELLIDLFARGVRSPKAALDRELKLLPGVKKDYLQQRGFAKLLLDRCELAIESPMEPEALRKLVFERAARAHQDAHPHALDCEAILDAIAGEIGLDRDAVRRALYADLAEEQVITAFDALPVDELVSRYNLALAQAVLLKATRLEITLPPQSVPKYRALFRAIKFHQLLFEVEGTASEGYTIVLDGPLSLFGGASRYGLAMALFLPHLLHCDGWEFEAEVIWGRGRAPRKFRLSHEDGLVTPIRLTGQWQPEEMGWFVAQFRKLKSDWDVSDEPELVDLDGRGVLVADYVFTHRGSGLVVPFEVFGYWRRGALESRLALLRECGPRDLIVGVGKELGIDPERSEGLPAEVYVFRSVPLAREVRERLARFLSD